MKLHDLGATVLIIGLLLGGHLLAKKNNPEYKAFITDVKQGVSDFNTRYIDPKRTPQYDIETWDTDIG